MGLAVFHLLVLSGAKISHKINARIYNYEPFTPLSQLKSNSIGMLPAPSSFHQLPPSLPYLPPPCSSLCSPAIAPVASSLTAPLLTLSSGKFVALRGTVIRVGNIRPLVTSMSFGCSRCGSEIKQRFVDGKFKQPEKCDTRGCRSQTFEPIMDSAVTIDWQKIK
jgi:hypothetical protein